jgi:hypothetical protein
VRAIRPFPIHQVLAASAPHLAVPASCDRQTFEWKVRSGGSEIIPRARIEAMTSLKLGFRLAQANRDRQLRNTRKKQKIMPPRGIHRTHRLWLDPHSYYPVRSMGLDATSILLVPDEYS